MKPIATAPSRAEQVYTAIRDSICDGSLRPGTHLVQEDLAARLGVSRQPVQQAMALLKNEGLVLEKGARGLYVAPLDADATVHHYQIRLSLDLLAARLTAERAARSPDFARQLLSDGERILAAGERALAKGSHRDAVAMDVEFHSFIYEMSGNPLIVGAAEPHWYYLRRVMVAVLNYAERGPIVWKQHRDILDALAAGKADEACAMVKAHILGAEAAFLRVLPAVAPPDPEPAPRAPVAL
ncbi:GntR family transcriptional regulator [Prosthecomicrobium sp. N25]|uniref:GntR family transcriptional regulator n=1 Tax=Prosthecomicrobium sp. N25 TaxID=3129254 RepID=UPI0030768F5F